MPPSYRQTGASCHDVNGREGERVRGDRSGIFFISCINNAEGYAWRSSGDGPPRIVSAYLRLENPLIIPAGPDDCSEVWFRDKRFFRAQIDCNKHDGAIVRNDFGDIMALVLTADQIIRTSVAAVDVEPEAIDPETEITFDR